VCLSIVAHFAFSKQFVVELRHTIRERSVVVTARVGGNVWKVFPLYAQCSLTLHGEKARGRDYRFDVKTNAGTVDFSVLTANQNCSTWYQFRISKKNPTRALVFTRCPARCGLTVN
jgi:hypothetical protein